MVFRSRRRVAPRIEEIEPRILFSADAAGLLADLRPVWEREGTTLVQQVELPSGTNGSSWQATHREAGALAAADEREAAGSLLQALAREGPAVTHTERAREVVFIDGAVPHLDTLVNALGPDMETVVLDSSRDGLQQMADYLQSRSGLGAVHLISEGASGLVHAGDRWINTNGLETDADALGRIGNALAPGGDFLLYGCRVGEADAGAAFMTELSRLTGADVAASIDATGDERQGGNWLLERHTGAVETGSILTSQNGSTYDSVLGVYAVTNTNDSGAGSLRQAIIDANANAGQDTVVFNIGTGAQTIALSSTVNVTGSVILDGTSQSGYTSSPLITITGNGLNADGLVLQAGAAGSTVKGLAINGFLSNVLVDSTSNVTLSGNYIGLNADGSTAGANRGNGIYLLNSSSITIGGIATSDRNVISGNAASGIFSESSSGNTIQGNYIGLAVDGVGAVANAGSGIYLHNGGTTLVGGTAAGAGNVISGNSATGVMVQASSGNTVQGNLIGLRADGTAALANGNFGIQVVSGSTNNTIGGTSAAARNVISGDSFSGVALTDATTTGNVVQGNYIGTNAAGTAAVANGWTGVLLFAGATGNTIGGTTAGAGNLISGNTFEGIGLDGASGNTLQGNLIGVAADGVTALANHTYGVYLHNGSDNNVIGGTATGAGNVISGNSFSGVALTDATTTGNVVQGNYIGTNAAGTAAVANGWTGVLLFAGATDNTIGGTTAGAGNVISGNTFEGIGLDGASGNTLQGNLIGVAADGVTALANHAYGVYLHNSSDNNVIGGTATGAGNVISGNSSQGIRLDQSSGTTIQGNWIGGTVGGIARGNGGAGIGLYNGSSSNQVGGTASGAGNIIANNSGNAVYIDSAGTASMGNSILRNSIYDNTGSAVVLSGTNSQDVGDVDGGANDGQNRPVLSSAYTAGGITDISGYISTTANTTLRIEFFTTPAAHTVNDGVVEGRTYLGFVQVTTDTNGYAAFHVQLADASAYHQAVSASATDLSTNDTSEFSWVLSNNLAVVTASAGTTGYTENGVAVAIDTGLSVSDVDNAALSSATVSITGNFTSGQDLLGFTNDASSMGNIAGSYDAATGVLTLNSSGATATLAEWQAALRAVTYANTSDNPGTANRTIGFVVNDGSASSAAATKTVSIAAVNDAPVLTGSGGTTGYIENGVAVAIDTGLSVSDVDNTALSSATVSITGNFASGQDLLGFANDASSMGNIAASYNAATGVLTLNSSGATATLAEWQAALRAVTYANTSDNPGTANRTIGFVVNDGSINSAAATKTVSVAAVNDAPVLTGSGGTTGYIENGAGVVINGGITVSDVDNAALSSATVSITGNFASGQDLLGFANDASSMGNIAGSYDAATGVLTLNSSGATATLAEWQAALRAVTYANNSDNPTTANRTISFIVNDGSASSAAATKTVSIAAVNDAPVVTASAGTTGYTENGGAIAIDPCLSVSDVDNTALSSATVSIIGNFTSGQDLLGFANDASSMGNIAGSYDAATGVLTLNSSGATATVAEWQAALPAVTYANSSDNPGTANRTISFIVDDGSINSTAATKTVSVAAVNDAPVLTGSGGTTGYTENGVAIAIDGGISVSDVDNTSLSTATVSITGNFASGQDLLGFANDASSMGNIAASYDAATGVLTLNSSGATATVAEWQAALRAVTYANNSDNPGTANRTIGFVVNDGSINSTAAIKTMSVAAVNDAPLATASGGTTGYTENGAAAVIDGAITVSDADNTSLSTATVSITGNFTSGQDLLGFANDGSSMGNIAGSYNAATGVLTLNSSGATATLAEWQAALRAVTYANSSDNPGTANRTIGFVVNDGSASSAAATCVVNLSAAAIMPSHQAPAADAGAADSSASPSVVGPASSLQLPSQVQAVDGFSSRVKDAPQAHTPIADVPDARPWDGIRPSVTTAAAVNHVPPEPVATPRLAEAVHPGFDFAGFDYASLLLTNDDASASGRAAVVPHWNVIPAGNHAARPGPNHGSSTDEVDEQPPMLRLIELTTMLVAGGAGFWSLRMSGLIGMLFASHPLWKELDPIALLPAPEAAEPHASTAPDTPEDREAEAELAAAELLDGVDHRGSNA